MKISTTLDGPSDPQILSGLCAKWGYTGFWPDGTTPQTQQDFVTDYLIKITQNGVISNETDVATRTASATAQETINQAVQAAQPLILAVTGTYVGVAPIKP